ncbi:uncharacterized protein LOC144559329 [Carex rostrata]
MVLQDRVIRIHFTDPDATDSDTDSDSDSFRRCQHKRVTKTVVIPHSIQNPKSQYQNHNPKSPNPSQLRQPSSKYRGVRRRQSGNWAAEIRDPIRKIRVWLGTFSSEEEAYQAYQAAYFRFEKEKAQIARENKTQLYQTATPPYQATALRIKKRKEVETILGPPVKEKQREDITSDNPTMDIVYEANKYKSSVKSAAHVITGSSSSVNTSAKPAGFLEDLSSQLLKQMEATTDADFMIGDFDSCDDLIQLDDLPLWTENLDCGDYSFLNF